MAAFFTNANGPTKSLGEESNALKGWNVAMQHTGARLEAAPRKPGAAGKHSYASGFRRRSRERAGDRCVGSQGIPEATPMRWCGAAGRRPFAGSRQLVRRSVSVMPAGHATQV